MHNNETGPETRPSVKKLNGEGKIIPFPYLLHAERFCMQEDNEYKQKKMQEEEEYLARRR